MYTDGAGGKEAGAGTASLVQTQAQPLSPSPCHPAAPAVHACVQGADPNIPFPTGLTSPGNTLLGSAAYDGRWELVRKRAHARAAPRGTAWGGARGGLQGVQRL